MKRDAVVSLKLRRLARAIGTHRLYAIGLLTILWDYCLREAPDGDLSGFDAEDLADLAEYEGEDRGRLMAALAETGWIDPHPHIDGAFVVHDWIDHCEDSALKKLRRVGRIPEGFDRRKDPSPPAAEFYPVPAGGPRGPRGGGGPRPVGVETASGHVSTCPVTVSTRRDVETPGLDNGTPSAGDEPLNPADETIGIACHDHLSVDSERCPDAVETCLDSDRTCPDGVSTCPVARVRPRPRAGPALPCLALPCRTKPRPAFTTTTTNTERAAGDHERAGGDRRWWW